MNSKRILKKIERRKMLLNFLLLFLTPTCILSVKLSQNLDLYIHKYQNFIAKKYKVANSQNYFFVEDIAA